MNPLTRGVWKMPFRDAHGFKLLVAVDSTGCTPFGFTRYFADDDPDTVADMLRRQLDAVDPIRGNAGAV